MILIPNWKSDKCITENLHNARQNHFFLVYAQVYHFLGIPSWLVLISHFVLMDNVCTYNAAQTIIWSKWMQNIYKNFKA